MNNYPIPTFHFQVDWGGTNISFAEVSGLKVHTNVMEYRGGANLEYTPIKMPGMQSYSNLTLKRGIFKGDNEFYEWWDSVQLNKIERRDITITLLNGEHEPVVVWKIKNAWPTNVEVPNLNAQSNDIAIESMEIVNEGIVIQND